MTGPMRLSHATAAEVASPLVWSVRCAPTEPEVAHPLEPGTCQKMTSSPTTWSAGQLVGGWEDNSGTRWTQGMSVCED